MAIVTPLVSEPRSDSRQGQPQSPSRDPEPLCPSAGQVRRGDRGVSAPPGADVQAVPPVPGGCRVLHQAPEPPAARPAAQPPVQVPGGRPGPHAGLSGASLGPGSTTALEFGQETPTERAPGTRGQLSRADTLFQRQRSPCGPRSQPVPRTLMLTLRQVSREQWLCIVMPLLLTCRTRGAAWCRSVWALPNACAHSSRLSGCFSGAAETELREIQ